MRFRGKSIRRKIVALLLVPLLALVATWAFAAWITSRGVFGMMDVQQVTDKIGYPVEHTIEALAAERRAALVFLADPHRVLFLQALRSAERATDQALTAVRDNSAGSAVRSKLDAGSVQRIDALVKRSGDLVTLRRQVDENQISREAAYTAYTDEIDSYYGFFRGFNPLQSVGLDRQARVLTELSLAREQISREDALYSSAQLAGRMDRQDQRLFGDAVALQRTLYATYPPLLPDSDRRLFDDYWKSSVGDTLHSAEERIINADADAPAAVARAVKPAIWQGTISSVLGDLDTLDHQAAENYMARVSPFATSVLVEAGVAGGFGLLAVILSVVISVRIGRGLTRDLSALRKEALEASGTRLPRVMRRLAAGEQIDVETEVPRLEYPDDEFGQVGRAVNTLQRAAVEAAVRQSDMRRGISDVFVNLARRSQVLLHRQLTLLDAMERRTEVGEELADLFRLDHMTTRMRRHAEGLVILSGAAPSRQWRKPIQLMDVVRAAVAEVEDYERVEVRRMPRLAVIGAAVADVTHLLAELIENATVFSPPHTAVQVHGERAANGFALEIDDRGLGMTPDALLDANLRLAETPEFELSDTDRLGLFVVSRLARRQGVRVSLRTSPYGGITAVVLLPHTVLTEDGQESSTTGEVAVGPLARLTAEHPGEPARQPQTTPAEDTFREWGMLPGDTGEELVSEPAVLRRHFEGALRPEDSEPAGETVQHQQAADPAAQPTDPQEAPGAKALPRRRHSMPVLVSDRGRTVDVARRHRTQSSATEEDTQHGRRGERSSLAEGALRPGRPEPSSLPEGSQPPASGGLPRRVRQASLAPQLRHDDTRQPDATAQTPGSAPWSPYERDADEVRSRMASLQRGWQRGRAEADDLATSDRPDGRSEKVTGTTSEGDGR